MTVNSTQCRAAGIRTVLAATAPLPATCLLLAGGIAAAQDVDQGAWLYGGFCATCHGIAGQGDGPMTEILTIRPADLTSLARDNDGVFPVGRIAQRIDGRDRSLAHGGPMPLFGQFFEGDDVTIPSEAGQPIMTSRGIADLIAHIETLQQ